MHYKEKKDTNEKNCKLDGRTYCKNTFQAGTNIMGTSFCSNGLQLYRYDFGQIGSDAVASVGTVGFFTRLASAFV